MKSHLAKTWIVLSLITIGNVSAYDTTAVVGQTVNFRGLSESDANYIWKFPDGTTQTEQISEYTFRKSGIQKVTLTVTKDTRMNSITKQIRIIQNRAPVGQISANKTAGIANETDKPFWFLADYSDPDGDDRELTYEWSIVDAFSLSPVTIDESSKTSTASNQSISHTFSSPGRYRIKVIVSDGFTSNNDIIYVNIGAPRTSDSGTQTGSVPLPKVMISTMRTSAKTGEIMGFLARYPNNATPEYLWSIKNAETDEMLSVTENENRDFSHTFSDPGLFLITVVATDIDTSTEDYKYIYITPSPSSSSDESNAKDQTDQEGTDQGETVASDLEHSSTNRAPIGRISAEKTAGNTGEEFWFVAEYSDPEDTELRYEWNIEETYSLTPVNISDTSPTQSASNRSMSHTFHTAGSYRVRVKVTDQEGLHSESTLRIYVVQPGNNLPPIASIYSVYPALQGTTDTIFRFYSQARDPNNDPLDYEWTIGNSTYNLQNIAYKFSTAGTYTVVLEVSDGTLSDEKSVNIEVFNSTLSDEVTVNTTSSPSSSSDESNATDQTDQEGTDQGETVASDLEHSSTNRAPIGRISAEKTAGNTGEEFWFVAEYSDPEDTELRYEWNIEETYSLTPVNISDTSPTQSASNRSMSHTFHTAGSYRVRVKVTDQEGLHSESTLRIYVVQPGNNLPPIASIYSVYPALQGTTDTIFRFYSQARDPNNDPLDYEWTIGNSTYNLQNIAYKFSTAGTYTVVLEVSDGTLSDEKSVNIEVFNSTLSDEVTVNTTSSPSSSSDESNASDQTNPEEHDQNIDIDESLLTEDLHESAPTSQDQTQGQIATVRDEAGNIHEVTVGASAEEIVFTNADGTTTSTTVRVIDENPAVLEITQPDETTQRISLTSASQNASIRSPSGRETQIEVTLATPSSTTSTETEISASTESISLQDSTGRIFNIPLDRIYHFFTISDGHGGTITIEAKGVPGIPSKLYIKRPTGEVQEIIITNTIQSITIPTTSEKNIIIQAKKVTQKTSTGIINKQKELASSFDILITDDQLNHFRKKKEEQIQAESIKEVRQELISDIALINQSLIMFRLNKRLGESNTGNSKLLNLEILKSQLETAKQEREKSLETVNSRSTTASRLRIEISRINKLLEVIRRDREKDNNTFSLEIQIPKENPIDILEQQKAQKEAEIQKAQISQNYIKAHQLQEELLTIDAQLAEVRATLPPPSPEKKIQKLKKEKEILVIKKNKLTEQKVIIEQTRVPFIEQKKLLKNERLKRTTELTKESDPKKEEVLKTKIKNITSQLKEVNQSIATADQQLTEVNRTILDIEEEVQTIEENILVEEEKLIELIDICKNPISINPQFLRNHLNQLIEQKRAIQAETEDKEEKKEIHLEISRLQVQADGVLIANDREEPCLDTRKINPSVLKKQLLIIKKQKEELITQTTIPEEKARLQSDIIRIDEQNTRLNKILETANVDLIINTNTHVFVYANIKGKPTQALLLEWDLGDGRTKMGQNVKFQYPDPGIYEIRLNVSGELTILSDSITIKVTEI